MRRSRVFSSCLLTIYHELCDLLPEAVTIFRHLIALRLANSQALAQTPGVRERFLNRLIFMLAGVIRQDQHQFTGCEGDLVNQLQWER